MIILLLFISLLEAHSVHTKIYDARSVPPLPGALNFRRGKLVFDSSSESNDLVPLKALALKENLEKTSLYFKEKFDLNSFDGKGSTVNASYNLGFRFFDIFGLGQNAFWDGKNLAFGRGETLDGAGWESSLEVVAHEFTHAVISHSANLKYEGESGALNEHLADILGIIIKNSPFEGEFSFSFGVFQRAGSTIVLRNLLHPDLSEVQVQPTHLLDLSRAPWKAYVDNCVASLENDYCGVHLLSGIPNLAISNLITRVGPEVVANLLFRIMTQDLKRESNFNEYFTLLSSRCMEFMICQEVSQSLHLIGFSL